MKVTLTKKEVEWLLSSLVFNAKESESIRKKLCETVTTVGLSASALEVAMEKTSRGKLIRLASGAGYAAASKMATRLGATAEDATTVGSWLSVQGWLSQVTLLDVLRKWDTWLPKARALNSPRQKGPSLDGNTGQGTTQQRSTTAPIRKPDF